MIMFDLLLWWKVTWKWWLLFIPSFLVHKFFAFLTHRKMCGLSSLNCRESCNLCKWLLLVLIFKVLLFNNSWLFLYLSLISHSSWFYCKGNNVFWCYVDNPNPYSCVWLGANILWLRCRGLHTFILPKFYFGVKCT